MYAPLKPSRSSTITLRHLNHHVREWGPEASPLPSLVLLHGWMDVSASWQFTVDALTHERRVIAPDWRGFGQTDSAQSDHYFFADYLADLDALLDHFSPDAAVDLVGHSMGGNIAMMYAGVRPARIRRLVNLEGFGLPATQPAQAPARYAQWLDELRQLRSGGLALKTYEGREGVAERLMKTNPRLGAEKAYWLAEHWARQRADGRWEILGDPAHKITSAQLFRVDEALALYASITAPLLAVEASDDSLGLWWKGKYSLQEYHQRLTHVRDCRLAVVQDAGHMLHHDQPQAVAGLIEDFCGAA